MIKMTKRESYIVCIIKPLIKTLEPMTRSVEYFKADTPSNDDELVVVTFEDAQGVADEILKISIKDKTPLGIAEEVLFRLKYNRALDSELKETKEGIK